MLSRLRIGSGFDIHPLSNNPDRRFLLGGIEISPGYGPIGHSDADVVCHAISDSILGSVGLGGIGDHFQDTNAELLGADSVALLEKCYRMFLDKGFVLINADVTVVLQRPRIAGFRSEIEANLSNVLGAPVSVKAKSAEQIGALGRGDGVACFASTLGFRQSD